MVTGASRGIGRQIARDLAKAGAKVAVTYRQGEHAGQAVADEISVAGGTAMLCQLDVSDAEQCADAVAKVEEKWGQIDILVNNAGVVKDNLFLMLEAEDWDVVLDVNLKGAVHCAKAVIRGMMMRRYGRIINISSVAGTKSGRGKPTMLRPKAL